MTTSNGLLLTGPAALQDLPGRDLAKTSIVIPIYNERPFIVEVLRRILAVLMPFFVLGLASGLWTAWLERHHVGAGGSEW
jgi:hypothetical protein